MNVSGQLQFPDVSLLGEKTAVSSKQSLEPIGTLEAVESGKIPVPVGKPTRLPVIVTALLELSRLTQ